MAKMRENIVPNNYCVSFIDLLGYRAKLRGQKLMPTDITPQAQKEFKDMLYQTVGSILRLQERSRNIFESALNAQDNELGYHTEELSPEQLVTWKEAHKTNLKSQYWSDGLVIFSCLDESEIKCLMTGIFHMILTTGTLCLYGLSSKEPIRGAIDIGWAAELRDRDETEEGELYGAAVANAYELESNLAQYPRIVVSQYMVDYLTAHIKNPIKGYYADINRAIAKTCWDLIIKDLDGTYIVHYLSDNFLGLKDYEGIYDEAYEYVTEQMNYYRNAGDSKLAIRYLLLHNYFLAHTKKYS